MQQSRNNVVEFSRVRTGEDHAQAALLDQCAEMAAARLAEALTKTLQRAAVDLLELTDQVVGLELRRLYGEAREFARDRHTLVEEDFRRRYFQRFKRACRRDTVSRAQPGSLDASQLRLQDPDELEESLAADNIANALNNTCGEELFGLSKRIGVLLQDPELQYGDQPLSPEIVGEVIMDSLRVQGLAFKARLVLVPLINKHLLGKVKAVYQDLNRFLIERGVLPTIRVGISRREEAQTAPAMGVAPAASAATGGDAAGDMFNLLRQLLEARAIPAAAPAAGGPFASTGPFAGAPLPGGMATPSSPSTSTCAVPSPSQPFMQTLTRLQRGDTAGLALAGFDAGHLGNGQINVLREIRDAGMTGAVASMDAMTLDIVAMVFDYILDDRRIPDAMKALIGRLQIPVLKVAMLDRSFFSQKAHPARRLLDSLADAAMGWDEEEGHDSDLYRRIDELVQRVLSQFDEQVDIFATVLEEFQDFRAEERQRIAALTSRSAHIIHQQEQREIGRVLAHDEVTAHLFDQPVNDFIRDFLFSHWERVLTHHYLAQGENGEGWRQAVAAMDDLIWSVRPKLDAAERKRLVERLPRLLKQLEQGLSVIGGSPELRDQFFTGLVKCHAEAVRAGLRDGTEPPLVVPPTPPLPVAPTAAAAQAGPEFAAVPASTEAVDIDPALMQDIAGQAGQDAPFEEITIGDVGWQPRMEDNATDRYHTQVRQLRRGAWIELRQPDGTRTKAKLAWVSPLKGIYLFTNRLGQRAMSINGEGLAAKLRSGEVQLIDSVPLMDRAVGCLLERLRNPATS